LSDLAHYGTRSVEFYCLVDNDLLSKYAKITEEQADKDLKVLYSIDDRIKRLFDSMISSFLSSAAGHKKVKLVAFYQVMRNNKTTPEDIVKKFQEFKRIEAEFKAMLIDTRQKFK